MPHGDYLLRLTDAIAARDAVLLADLRQEGVAVLDAAGLVDAIGVGSGFNAITRVTDATGIPWDGFLTDRRAGVREVANINQFRARKELAQQT